MIQYSPYGPPPAMQDSYHAPLLAKLDSDSHSLSQVLIQANAATKMTMIKTRARIRDMVRP